LRAAGRDLGVGKNEENENNSIDLKLVPLAKEWRKNMTLSEVLLWQELKENKC